MESLLASCPVLCSHVEFLDARVLDLHHTLHVKVLSFILGLVMVAEALLAWGGLAVLAQSCSSKTTMNATKLTGTITCREDILACLTLATGGP